MKILKIISLLFAFGVLQGCASDGTSSPQDVNTTNYSPATTNTSYMYRSPPPAVANALAGGQVRGR